MKHILAAVALASVSIGASAQLAYSGGTNITFSGYDPSGTTGVQTQGLREAMISSTIAGNLTATFLGKEALDTDTYTFAMASGTLLNTSAIGSMISGPVGVGNLNFTFADTFAGTSVGNGGVAGAYTSYVILGSYVTGGAFTPYTDGGLYQMVLGFNDGLKVDADYDDMVVGLNVSAVPEPETYALMLAGIGAIGFIARRRKQSST
ncbi:MAG: PEP-CTERM sorting domain-containing protein [Caldimonas sp.]